LSNAGAYSVDFDFKALVRSPDRVDDACGDLKSTIQVFIRPREARNRAVSI
jgi:hypothetical protein